MDKPGRHQLSADEAIAMMADGARVHTFVNGPPNMLIGAAWDREDLIKRFRDPEKQPPELSGDHATAMDHGVCFWHDLPQIGDRKVGCWVFVETKPKN